MIMSRGSKLGTLSGLKRSAVTHITFCKGHREIQTMPVPYKKFTFMLWFWTKNC